MRLTKYQPTEGGIPYVVVKDEQEALQKLAAYEDTGLEPEAVDNLRLSLFGAVAAEIAEEQGYVEVNRAKEIAHAEAEGRLVVLPKKLYGFYEWDVTGVRYYDGKVTAYYVKREQMESIIYECEIGDSVFLTREEAEAAWKGGHEDAGNS